MCSISVHVLFLHPLRSPVHFPLLVFVGFPRSLPLSSWAVWEWYTIGRGLVHESKGHVWYSKSCSSFEIFSPHAFSAVILEITHFCLWNKVHLSLETESLYVQPCRSCQNQILSSFQKISNSSTAALTHGSYSSCLCCFVCVSANMMKLAGNVQVVQWW